MSGEDELPWPKHSDVWRDLEDGIGPYCDAYLVPEKEAKELWYLKKQGSREARDLLGVLQEKLKESKELHSRVVRLEDKLRLVNWIFPNQNKWQ